MFSFSPLDLDQGRKVERETQNTEYSRWWEMWVRMSPTSVQSIDLTFSHLEGISTLGGLISCAGGGA